MQLGFYTGQGADSEVTYNLCLSLKIMLEKSCRELNITLFATAFICMYL
jgi:hypothetical protein